MEILWETAAFATKALVVFLVFLACVLVLFSLYRRARSDMGVFRVQRINEQLKRATQVVGHVVLGAKELRKRRKEMADAERKRRKKPAPRVFLLDFRGDIAASAVIGLRQEITVLLQVASEGDEVIVRIESSGGLVPHYGLAAAQLVRIKERGLRLTACIDKVAASGGYMMACVADEILAAPFAILGSIGVAAPVPNIHRWLTERGIDYDEMTAGEYKRTISFLAEITEKGRERYQEQIEATHQLFKDFIRRYRPAVDIDEVATGEYWHAGRAQELGLVNRLTTSDDYILSKIASADVFVLTFTASRTWRERLASTVSAAAEKLLLNLWTRAEDAKFQ